VPDLIVKPYDPNAYANSVLADSPIGYWKFDQASGTAIDSSGNGRNLTYSDISIGTPSYQQQGLFNNAPYSVRITNKGNKWSASGIPYGNSFSIEYWFKTDGKDADGTTNLNLSSYGRLISNSPIGGGFSANGFYVMGMSGFNLYAGIGGPSSYTNLTTTSASYADSTWRHLVMTASYGGASTTLNLYANGALLLGPITRSGSVGGTASISIGDYLGTAGTFCQVAVYNKALSLSRIQAHYNIALDGA